MVSKRMNNVHKKKKEKEEKKRSCDHSSQLPEFSQLNIIICGIAS